MIPTQNDVDNLVKNSFRVNNINDEFNDSDHYTRRYELISNLKESLNLIGEGEVIEDSKEIIVTNCHRELFDNIMSKINKTMTDIEYPCSIFYLIDDTAYIEHNTKTNDFNIRYCDFFELFGKNIYDIPDFLDSDNDFDAEFNKIKVLFSKLIQEHFNINVNNIDILLNWETVTPCTGITIKLLKN